MIKSFLNKIKNYLHIHGFSKIIISQYHTFNYRKVIVECRCGKRELQTWHHDNVYPIETTLFITNKEMKQYLNKTK